MGYKLESNDFWYAPSMVRNIQWMMRTGDQFLALRMASAWAPTMNWWAGCALLTGRKINGWTVEFEVGPDGEETGNVFVVKA
jgi:hypothetical protein